MIRKKSLLLLILVVGALFWFGQSDARKGSTSPPNTTGVTNPLPPCPEKPNCVRASRYYNVDADDLFKASQTALERMRASQIESNAAEHTLQAVAEVFVFKDDVSVFIRPHEAGSVVHLRSASRTGHSDWGVNARRASEFWEELGDVLTP